MSISPVSNLNALFGSQAVQPPAQKPGASNQPTDTVQLSPAALAHLKAASGDADHDGDSK
jgi:hypothetical protein